ncbi:MAG: acetyl-CoA C-acetyltransferase [Anaerolineae bacterium]|nr:acetyl-CoA C-acetyltransferase [Anaerolineae bacterium]
MRHSNHDPVILSAARTPIGKFQGALSRTPAVELGGIAIAAAIERAGISPDLIDEVIVGNVVQAGEGVAPARQAALRARVPESVGATTVNKVCGSGLKAVMLAASAIRAGDGELYVAGGMENMNLAPYLLPQARTGYRLGNAELVDAVVHDGLWCPVEQWHFGRAAEWVARTYEVTREDQDAYALKSHRRAVAAIDAGKFRAETVGVPLPQKKGPPLLFDTDECPRRDTSAEALARLSPAFEEGGTVTAGNAPGVTDGAAALVIASQEKAKELGVKPLARITGYAQAAVKPVAIFTAPVHAVGKLLAQLGRTLDDMDLLEINEAFAAQVLANGNELGVNWERVNVHGGAVALGHPIGCSGARVLTTLLYALKDRGLRTGLATLCLGGGEAVALSVEMMDA